LPAPSKLQRGTVTARLAAEEVWRGEGEPWLGRTAAGRRRAAAEGFGGEGDTEMAMNSNA